MYECFHCLARAVVWDCDYSYDDIGREGEGIVHVCHCANCGAWIEYYIDCGSDDEDEARNELQKLEDESAVRVHEDS